MEALPPGSLFQFPVKWSQKLGYLTDGKVTKTALFFMVVAASISILNFLLALGQLIFIPNNIFGLIENGENLGAQLQVTAKIIILMYKKQQIKNLISRSKEFWNSDTCTKNTQDNVNKVSQTICKFQKAFLSIYIICLLFMAVPVIVFGKTLPIGIWQIQDHPKLYIVFVTLYQIFLIYFGVVVECLDALFMSFCVEVALQFKILCDGIEKLSVEKISSESDLKDHFDELKKYIKYHKFLISYLTELKATFSFTLMVQYFSTVPLVCTNLYAIMESPNIVFSIRVAITGFCEFLQLALYCITAEYVSNEASKVSAAVYSSDWYSQHFKILKVPINMFIEVSQKDVEFTASGLIKINANTMVNVFRLAMSTSTVLRNMQDVK